MELLHERTYGNHLRLQGVVERFADSLAGARGYIEEENDGYVYDYSNDQYFGTWKLDNGFKVEVEIYFDDEKEEWVCRAYKTN